MLTTLGSACTALDSVEYGPSVYPEKAHVARDALPAGSEILAEGFGEFWHDVGFEHFREGGTYLSSGNDRPEPELAYVALTTEAIFFLRWIRSRSVYVLFYELPLASVNDCYRDSWGKACAIVLTQKSGRPVSFNILRNQEEMMSVFFAELRRIGVCQ